MNPLLAMFGDPIWQILTVILVLALPVGIMAVRTRDMHASADQKRRETRRVLLLCLIVFVLLSGGEILFHARQTSPPQVASHAFSSIPTRGPTAAPPPTSDPSPDPTPTPRLARSMTQVLTTFCDAITTQDYQTAWKQYARSLQQAHPEPETFAAWRKFTRCSIPDQSGDPSALTVLTLTFAAGSTDRFRRSGDVDYRLTMGVEDHAWKITGVCDILSEGCFAVSWGEKEVALILIITLRSPDLHLAARHQGFLTRLTLLVCLTLFLVLSAGVVLFHKVCAASTVGSEVMRPRAATAPPHGGSLPRRPPHPHPRLRRRRFPGSPRGQARCSPCSAMPSTSRI